MKKKQKRTKFVSFFENKDWETQKSIFMSFLCVCVKHENDFHVKLFSEIISFFIKSIEKTPLTTTTTTKNFNTQKTTGRGKKQLLP